jgi:hypothetical protein
LAEKYGYTPLPIDLSSKYRQFFSDNTPSLLSLDGADNTLTTLRGTVVCNGYRRIVVGDYGAFVEFTSEQAYRQFVDDNADTIFTVVYDERYTNPPTLVCLEEDETKWLWYEGHLKKVDVS